MWLHMGMCGFKHVTSDSITRSCKWGFVVAKGQMLQWRVADKASVAKHWVTVAKRDCRLEVKVQKAGGSVVE